MKESPRVPETLPRSPCTTTDNEIEELISRSERDVWEFFDRLRKDRELSARSYFAKPRRRASPRQLG